MSKKLFALVIGSTYASLTAVYSAGQSYTAEQLGSNVDAQNDEGDNYFAEVEADAGEAPARTGNKLSIGKKSASTEGDDAAKGAAGGDQGKTVTV